VFHCTRSLSSVLMHCGTAHSSDMLGHYPMLRSTELSCSTQIHQGSVHCPILSTTVRSMYFFISFTLGTLRRFVTIPSNNVAANFYDRPTANSYAIERILGRRYSIPSIYFPLLFFSYICYILYCDLTPAYQGVCPHEIVKI